MSLPTSTLVFPAGQVAARLPERLTPVFFFFPFSVSSAFTRFYPSFDLTAIFPNISFSSSSLFSPYPKMGLFPPFYYIFPPPPSVPQQGRALR